MRASVMCGAMLSFAGGLRAAFPEFVDPHPAAGNQFGTHVVALSTGNVVITAPLDDFGGTNAGAVYLFNGVTGALISTLRGSAANHEIGSGGVTALANGNYVVASPNWDNGAIGGAGAVTWGSGTTGVSGTVSAANSLVGTTANNIVGGSGVTALANGNYVVRSPNWDNGGILNVGAVTWGSGTTGVSGAVSAANSLVGTTASDAVGISGVTALANGNYVVTSENWGEGAGAVTWGSGTTGVSGAVSAANSLVGTTVADAVGSGGVTALANGNYVVASPIWTNGATTAAGAVTWGSGTTGVSGAVSAANSLVGTTTNDQVGGNGVTALANGNYVVASRSWDNGAIVDVGAVTWGSGTSGVSGVASAANSLVGTTANNQVGSGVTALANGNYVVRSPNWDNGGILNVGAVTWGSGTSGVSGVVSAANSLVGTTASDLVGNGGVTALANGNYVVASQVWDNGAIVNTGAVTWGSGTTGVSGAVSAANSLVGSTVNDNVGSSGVTGLANGNYVVMSEHWDNGGIDGAGAVTWRSGTSGASGVVSAANSLVGTTANEAIGAYGVTALANGNYVVASPSWDNGAIADAGAATWGSGTSGWSGTISAAYSLVGTAASAALLSPFAEDTVNATFFAVFVNEGGGRVRVGQAEPSPAVVSAVDIPDQGGWLRLTFDRSPLDDPGGSPPVASYAVWRLVPGPLAAGAPLTTGAGDAQSSAALDVRPGAPAIERLRALLPAGLQWREADGQLFVTASCTRSAKAAAAFPPGTWALVASVPAVQRAQYAVEVPTISNSAPNDFVVTAHTTTPSVWFISNAISGQSLDVLAPAQPTQLTAGFTGLQTILQWAANTENDLCCYRLHRGTSADFTPSPGNRIATTTSTSHADAGPAGGHYKLSAVDVSGNESSFALVTPEQTLDVGEGEAVVFALAGARPNPAREDALHVAFALPSGAPARLELLDVGGRRVLAREVGSLGPGRHVVNLAEGRRVAAGIYWVVLEQGREQRRTRVAVVR